MQKLVGKVQAEYNPEKNIPIMEAPPPGSPAQQFKLQLKFGKKKDKEKEKERVCLFTTYFMLLFMFCQCNCQ